MLRFWVGTATSVLAGMLRYRDEVFDPAARPFECIYIGALAAGMLVTIRADRPRHGLTLVVGFALLQLSFNAHAGAARALTAGLTGLFVAGGLFLIAVMFDAMARGGLRFGKFLVVGMMMAWLYFAVTPVAAWGQMLLRRAFHDLMGNFVLGMTVGLGVGLGVELVELLPGLQPGPRRSETTP